MPLRGFFTQLWTTFAVKFKLPVSSTLSASNAELSQAHPERGKNSGGANSVVKRGENVATRQEWDSEIGGALFFLEMGTGSKSKLLANSTLPVPAVGLPEAQPERGENSGVPNNHVVSSVEDVATNRELDQRREALFQSLSTGHTIDEDLENLFGLSSSPPGTQFLAGTVRTSTLVPAPATVTHAGDQAMLLDTGGSVLGSGIFDRTTRYSGAGSAADDRLATFGEGNPSLS